MNQESQRLLDALNRNRDIIQNEATYGIEYDQYYVLARLQNRADPNSKYPDGTKAITRVIENLEQARIKEIVEEYYKNLNIIGVLLDAGVILSEADETKLDKNVDKHTASYLIFFGQNHRK